MPDNIKVGGTYRVDRSKIPASAMYYHANKILSVALKRGDGTVYVAHMDGSMADVAGNKADALLGTVRIPVAALKESVSEITTTGSAASFIGGGMRRAMSNSNRTNSKFGCSGCGAVMPKYEGRYLANCPACGTPIVRRTSERIHEVGHGSRVACPVSGQTGTVSQVNGPLVEVRWDSGQVEIVEGLFLDPVAEAPVRTIKTPKSGAPVQRKQTGTVPRIKPVRNIGEVSAYDPLGIGRDPLVSYRGGDPYILLNGTTPQEADAYRGTFLEFITIPEANSTTPCRALTMFKDGQVKGSVRMDNPNLLEDTSGFLRDVFGAVEAPVAMQELKVALRAARQTG